MLYRINRLIVSFLSTNSAISMFLLPAIDVVLILYPRLVAKEVFGLLCH